MASAVNTMVAKGSFAVPLQYTPLQCSHHRTIRCTSEMMMGSLEHGIRVLPCRSMCASGYLGAAHHRGPLQVCCAAGGAAQTQAPPASKPKRPPKDKDGEKDAGPYKGTVNLPQTKFNMRANSTQKEPEIQRRWQEKRVYEQLVESNPGPIYTLHDGPPYANGDTHLGHALNKVLKSIIVQYKVLRGARPRYVPGWDCHGLPIELKVLQGLSPEQRQELTPIALRRKARDFALKTMKAQREQFRRYGVWGDWEAPYLTLDPKYEAAQLRVFGQLVKAGHIYRGRKPVHWSPSSGTALAEAELEYPEGHTSRSVYVALPCTSLGEGVPEAAREALQEAALAVWTTTAWTLPANLAVAVNDRLQYTVVQAQGEAAEGWRHKKLVVAHDMISTLEAKLGVKLEPLASLSGAELEGCQYRHPLYDRTSPVVVGGDYITTESGTGLVHTAPGHGQEDYLVGQRYGLPLLSPVDDEGRFTDEAAPFGGLPVLKEGTAAVIDALRSAGALLAEEKYAHKYPYDWRTKLPTIFRATDQWFVSVNGFREAALDAVGEVEWIPGSGEKRISNMVEGRSDWCISRQRSWGVPIPALYHTSTGEALMTEETINHIAAVVEAKGSDAFWQLPVEDLLPEHMREQAPHLRKQIETMDVWFDSGTSWAGVLEARPGLNFPADLYLEGSDQHRGWFQSSLLTATAARGQAPYKKVLTHGFTLDEKGNKMSKSLGNVVDPRTIIEGGKDKNKEPPYGADVLRLWVASVDYSGDVVMGPFILSQVADVYRKIRFTLRYILGNLHDFDPERDAVPYEQLPATDRFILYQFEALLNDVASSYDAFQFYRVYQAVQRFVVTDLSNWYLDVAKDRLYVRGPTSSDRRACQTVLHALLQGLLPVIAPILPHLAEDAWEHVPYRKEEGSIFQAGWQPPSPLWQQGEAVAPTFRAILALRGEVNQVLEKARRDGFIGAGLEARVLLAVANDELVAALQQMQQAENGADPLRYEFIVSQVELVGSREEAEACDYSATSQIEGIGEVTVGVSRARGSKCERCWNYSEQVGAASDHPTLCERCVPVIRESGFAMPEQLSTAPVGSAVT